MISTVVWTFLMVNVMVSCSLASTDTRRTIVYNVELNSKAFSSSPLFLFSCEDTTVHVGNVTQGIYNRPGIKCKNVEHKLYTQPHLHWLLTQF